MPSKGTLAVYAAAVAAVVVVVWTAARDAGPSVWAVLAPILVVLYLAGRGRACADRREDA